MAEAAAAFIARKKAELLTKPVMSKDIGGKGKLVWKREAVTLRAQSNYPEKVFLLERMRLVEVVGERLRAGGAAEGDIEYRLGYYTVSRADKWWWGQYALFIPAADLLPLLRQALEDETIEAHDLPLVSAGGAL